MVVLAAALLAAPTTWRAPAAIAATATAFTDVPTTATVGEPYTVSGTVTDESPVAGVEASTDAGVTWQPATWQVGQTTWSHTFTPQGSGPVRLRVRALDTALNTVGEADAETSVAARVCPCGLWSDSDVPANVDAADDAAVELGVKWRSTHDGHVRGVRFYKGPGNTGTHTGSLWSTAGVLLATGTFRDETAGGWQTLAFPRPVAVERDTTYVASYTAPAGHYSYDHGYFARSSRYLEPLTGLQTGVDGANGVFRPGRGFPTTASADTNYWVDVVWSPEPGADTRAPEVAATTPADGAGSTPLTAAVTAAFDEPVAPDSAEFTLTGPGGPVGGVTSSSGNGMTVEFKPGAPLSASGVFTASVRVRDAAGNQAAAHTWQFTTGAPRGVDCPCTLWDDFTVPGNPASADAQAVELGVKVRFTGVGEVLGVRFYKGEGNTGTHTGSLWTSTGLLLATGTFTGETKTGWQTLAFAAPVVVQRATDYVVSYYAPNGRYAADPLHFLSPRTYGPISAAGNSENGLFRYGGGFPTGAAPYAANYWVDVVYRNGSNGDYTRPTLDTRTPGPNGTDAPLDQPLVLGFSEPVDPDSVVVIMTDVGGSTLHGTSTYSADGRTLTWTPNGTLKPDREHRVRVRATDSNGNAMISENIWTFTTRAVATCPCTLFSRAAVPDTPAANDSGSYELGVRFTTSRGGWVNGVRFYKGEGNTGTHTGSLWTSGGERIATGTFVDETATGWQTLLFAQPVPIAPNEVYVASYTAPHGRYAISQRFFQRGGQVVSAPLSTAAHGTGVFMPGGGFPNRTWDDSNYWVDVDFTPSTDTTPLVHVGHAPADDAVDAPLGPITATWDKPMSAVGSTFRVVDPRGMVMQGRVTRAADHRTLAWTPVADLVRGTTYTVTVRAVDFFQNVTAEPVTWSYTTGDPPCPCSLFSEAAVPEEFTGTYYGAAGLGIKFVPAVDGFVTGVKYYKSSASAAQGATLSLPDGTALATGAFTGQSHRGWQRMTFATPVPVTAGTTYLAWTTSHVRYYFGTEGYFQSGGVTTPRLTAPGGPGSPNGMFGSKDEIQADFPRTSTNHNYWVDVVFTTS